MGTDARDTRPNQSLCAWSGGAELARRHFLAGADAAARGWAVERHPGDGDGDLLALTLDDGVNTDVVRLYTQFAKDTGVRLTYLVNGTYKSWTEHRDLPRPLVEAAQIRLNNHAWSHPDLATLPNDQVVEPLRRIRRLLMRN